MNPPSALYGAMGREKKPFTYTPGGLDLSEIKSERMAKRLMRNAMNQGVPEVPVQQIQSPPATSNIALPNFNCLPVQVFPTINLPANPKSLLRTRSNPDNPREPIQRPTPQSQIPKLNKLDSGTATSSKINNNNHPYQRPLSMYDQGNCTSSNTLPKTIDERNNCPILPEISYEAEYFQTSPKTNNTTIKKLINPEIKSDPDNSISQIATGSNSTLTEQPSTRLVNGSGTKIKMNENLETANLESMKNTTKDIDVNTENVKLSIENQINEDFIENKCDLANDKIVDIEIIDSKIALTSDNPISLDFSIEPLSNLAFTPRASTDAPPVEEQHRTDDEQKQVKVVKKQVKKETKSEVHNGDQNGDANVEAELTVKLPTKKSAAKTETNVEVVKKQLPDGSIEEVKTTTTRTTVDGVTKIATKTETTITPKPVEVEVEEEVEEEEEEEEYHTEAVQEVEEKGDEEEVEEVVTKTTEEKKPAVENGDTVVKKEERSETTTTTTKKVTVVEKEQSDEEEEVEEEEEEEVEETQPTVVAKPPSPKEELTKEVENEEVEEEEVEEVEEEVVQEKQVTSEEKVEEKEEEVEEEEEEVVEEQKQESTSVSKENEEEVEEEYEENEEVEETVTEEKISSESTKQVKVDEEPEKTDEVIETENDEVTKSEPEAVSEPKKKQEIEEKAQEIEQPTPKPTIEPAPQIPVQPVQEPTPTVASQPEPKIPPREPSIPLEKVEDIEIKPIGPVSESVTKSHSHNTEIITTERPSGPLSTQTEYNRVENIVTVNRTIKTLDQTYENTTQHGVPSVKTYFAPTKATSPQPSKPYQPAYTPAANPPTERRHSLLLERLSMERQQPTAEIYPESYQSYEPQSQWVQEPQAEVLTLPNVKPSKITNQQWYQQSKKEHTTYSSAPTTPATQTWKQPLQHQPISQPAPQPQVQPPIQPQYQAQPQPQYQPQPQTQPTYQPSYTENTTNTYQQNSYQTYTPKPTWGTSSVSNTDVSSTYTTQPNQYSFLNKNSSESYQKTTQQYTSSYVPPPWEQDSSYVVDTSNQYQQPPPTNQYQPPQPAPTFTPSTNQGWTPPKNKFAKPPPTAYIPPAPNQSFVKSVSTVEPPRVPGKKTYYSEYERRYITVPESTYVPSETKPSVPTFQAQPDPSPQYYYDNNEPVEPVEPQWRKELREFTEKTSQTQTVTEQVSVKPPWEEDPKYEKAPAPSYSSTPTWSQTLRPRSWRERSFESDYVGSQEANKTNTLGRRPLSSYGKSNVESIPERPRGVSVDRYNPNIYQSPIAAEHPPVQTHTLTVVPPAKSYHNPNIPAYHTQSRASAEPREPPTVYQQPRQHWGESRASPIQSRSFKYLQWITGTGN